MDDGTHGQDRDRFRAEQAVASEALRCRLSVLRNLDRPDRGIPLTLDLMDIPGWLATPAQLANADLIRNQLITMLAEAEMFPAPAEVCRLLNGPAENGPSVALSYPGETLNLPDMIVPTGMVYFDEPITDPVNPVDLMPIRAMSWSVARGDDPAIRYLDLAPGTLALTLIGYTDTRTLPGPSGKPLTPEQLQNYPRIKPVLPIIWEIGVKGGGIFWDDPAQAEMANTLRLPYIKTMLAWWSIMRQRLTRVDEIVVKRHPRELEKNLASARRRWPELNTGMQLIRLAPRRRYVYTDYSGFNRPDWKNSWQVRAHWRPDWRAARRGEEKYQLIESYPKGPADRPMRGVERAFLPPLPPRSQRDDG